MSLAGMPPARYTWVAISAKKNPCHRQAIPQPLGVFSQRQFHGSSLANLPLGLDMPH
jgi:hypothetical protein